MNILRRHLILSIVLKIILITCFASGLFFTYQSQAFMSMSPFLYYTIQSNTWIALVELALLTIDIISFVKNKEIKIPYFLYIIKYVCVVAITITFTVFFVLLAPYMASIGYVSYLYSPSNLFPHLFVPLFALADFFAVDYKFQNKKFDFFWGLSTPLYYLAFAMICYGLNVDFGGGQRFPYFFLDFLTNGWFNIGDGKFGVFYWIVILILYVIGLSFLIMFIKNIIKKKVEKKQNTNN